MGAWASEEWCCTHPSTYSDNTAARRGWGCAWVLCDRALRIPRMRSGLILNPPLPRRKFPPHSRPPTTGQPLTDNRLAPLDKSPYKPSSWGEGLNKGHHEGNMGENIAALAVWEGVAQMTWSWQSARPHAGTLPTPRHFCNPLPNRQSRDRFCPRRKGTCLVWALSDRKSTRPPPLTIPKVPGPKDANDEGGSPTAWAHNGEGMGGR